MEPSAPPPSDAPSAPPTFVRRHLWKLVLVGFVLLVVGVGALYTMATLWFTYSTGERVGFVQKLSHKGWVCRTWEGELAMTPVPGSAPQIFEFSIRDESVVRKIEALQGKKVTVAYEQKKGIPTTCFGETMYFATDVRPAAQ